MTGMAPIGKGRSHPAGKGLGPGDVGNPDLEDEGQADHGDETHDPLFQSLVVLGEEHPDRKTGRQQRPGHQRQSGQHVEADGRPQQFGQGGGDAGDHGAPQHHDPQPGLEECGGGLGEAQAGDDPQMGGVVLDDDQDDRGEGHDPEQLVAELRAGGHVGDPVARVDKADRDEEAGADIAEEFERSQARGLLADVGEPVHDRMVGLFRFQIKDEIKAARSEATKAYHQYVVETKTSQRR